MVEDKIQRDHDRIMRLQRQYRNEGQYIWMLGPLFSYRVEMEEEQ